MLPAGTDVLIFKIFSPKNSEKKLAFLTQNKAKLCKILIITLVFEKNANFFAENWQKSQKIVIITSTPGTDSTKQYGQKLEVVKYKLINIGFRGLFSSLK
jgi:hypothetical protein